MGGGRTIKGWMPWLAGFALALGAIAPIALHWLANPIDQRMVDLDVYRTSGQVLLRGGRLYDFLTQPPQLLPFTYPPFSAVLAIPLAWLPWPGAATWAWVVLVYAALVVAVLYAFREPLKAAGRWAPALGGLLVGACAVLMPVGDQIRFGQVDVILVALCAADCLTRSPRWPRGALIGTATAIKLVPGVFLVYLLITGRRREAGNAALTAGAITLGTFAVLPRDSADFWFGALFDSGRVGANNGTANQSINAMLLRLYLPHSVTSVLWLASALVMAYAGFRLARRASFTSDALGGLRTPAGYQAELIGVAITGLLAVLLSPVAWIHHLSWLVLVLGALAGRPPLILVTWLFYTLPIPWWGSHLIGAGHPVPMRVVGRVIQDGYGLGAIILILTLGIPMVNVVWSMNQVDVTETSPGPREVGTLTW